MKKSTKYIVICIAILSITKILQVNGIHSEFRIVEPIVNLLTFMLYIIVPLWLIFLIKNIKLKLILLAFNLVLLFILSPIIGLVFLVLGNNVINENVMEKRFEQKLSNNNYFCVYLTPGGAFAFSDPPKDVYSIDTKLPLGIVKSNFLLPNEYKIYHDEKNDTETIKIDNDSIFIDRKSFKGY